MTRLLLFGIALLPMLGCANMTPNQQRAALIVGGIVVGAALIAAGDQGDDRSNCRPSSTGGVFCEFGPTLVR